MKIKLDRATEQESRRQPGNTESGLEVNAKAWQHRRQQDSNMKSQVLVKSQEHRTKVLDKKKVLDVGNSTKKLNPIYNWLQKVKVRSPPEVLKGPEPHHSSV